MRHKTKEIQIGKVTIGRHKSDCHSVYDKYENRRCESNGSLRFCSWRRQAVKLSAVPIPTMEAAKSLEEIKKQIHIPLDGGQFILITALPLQRWNTVQIK